MKALKEMLLLALLAPFTPIFFVLGLFEVRWAVSLMNPDANLGYTPSKEEISLMEALVEREKAVNRAKGSSLDGGFGEGINPDSGLPLRGGVDANGYRIGRPNNDFSI